MAKHGFWNKVDKTKTCWNWKGSLTHNGYAQFTREGKRWRVCRWLWTFLHGPIADNHQVLHKCDNRACVRLTHLFIGTPKDNTQDMIRKGRDRFIWSHH